MKRAILTLLSLLLFCSATLPQKGTRVVAVDGSRSKLITTDGPRAEIYELDSRLIQRKLNFAVVLPDGYSDKQASRRIYPVLYLLHGLSGRFDNWIRNADLSYSKGLDLIIVTPEGGNGWYTDSVTVPNDKYESYIIKELIPEIDNRFRTIADRRGRMIAGLSMGGYGAIKFGLKYPGMFSLVGSFSGALDAPLRGQDSKYLRPSILSVFGTDDGPVRKANDVFRLLRDMPADAVKNLPYIYLSCGTEDFLFQANRDFDALLIEKKVPHEYRELPGGHTWTFWDAQVKEFLRLADSRLKPDN